MAGYSGTPLVKKLGFKEGFRAALVNPPKGFQSELDPLPADVKLQAGPLPKHLDLVLLFVESQQTLKKEFPKLARKLADNGMLWIAWPKKSSGVPTDLSDNSVRCIGLNAGLVDVKVCAVNDVWSGLKFVYRLQDRKLR
jgi:alkylation response protein AidB-like acyl-CoA dehydrogenase